jgi:hypothetical protein
MSSSFYSTSSSSYTSSINGQTTSYTQSTQSDPSGTRVHQTSQEPGQAPREERFEIDSSGKKIAEGTSGSSQGRIEDVTDEQQKENDRLYEERMEDEYAKREGGA